jgi:hypothetical protein
LQRANIFIYLPLARSVCNTIFYCPLGSAKGLGHMFTNILLNDLTGWIELVDVFDLVAIFFELVDLFDLLALLI